MIDSDVPEINGGDALMMTTSSDSQRPTFFNGNTNQLQFTNSSTMEQDSDSHSASFSADSNDKSHHQELEKDEDGKIKAYVDFDDFNKRLAALEGQL